LLVPGLSSCEQINSLTSAILSAARVDFGLPPLPARRVSGVTAEPVSTLIINPTTNLMQYAQAPVFVRITSSYRDRKSHQVDFAYREEGPLDEPPTNNVND